MYTVHPLISRRRFRRHPPMPTPVAGNVSPGSGAVDSPISGGIGDLLAGSAGQGQPAPTGAPGMDAARDQLTGVLNAIRQINDQVQALAQMVPALADSSVQIQNILKSMVVKAAQPAPEQTMSSAMVPGAGGGA